jgi:hypothetical protein
MRIAVCDFADEAERRYRRNAVLGEQRFWRLSTAVRSDLP